MRSTPRRAKRCPGVSGSPIRTASAPRSTEAGVERIELTGRAYRYRLSHADWLAAVGTSAKARYLRHVIGEAAWDELRCAGPRHAARHRARPDRLRRRGPPGGRHPAPRRVSDGDAPRARASEIRESTNRLGAVRRLPAVSDAQRLVADVETRLRPLEVSLGAAWWEANTRSSPAADRLKASIDLERRALLADAATFTAIREQRNRARDSAAVDPLIYRQLDVLYDTFAPHQVPADLRAPDRRARDGGRRHVQRVPRRDRRRAGRRQHDPRDPAHERRHRAPPASVGGVEAGRGRGRRPGPGARPACATRRRAPSVTATTSRSRSPPASSTRTRLFETLDEVDAATTRAVRGVEGRARRTPSPTASDARVDELRPWHLDDPFFQDVAGRRAPSTSIRSSPTPTSRRSRSAPTTASASTSAPCSSAATCSARAGQEPARVLHRHRPRGRRAGALQQHAERALDRDDAPRVRPRGLRHAALDRDAPVARSAAPRTRSPPRASRCSSAASSATPSGSGRRRRRPTRARRARAAPRRARRAVAADVRPLGARR